MCIPHLKEWDVYFIHMYEIHVYEIHLNIKPASVALLGFG